MGSTTYLANLLAQDMGLDNHALAVRCLPQRAGKRVGTPLLEADTDSEVLDAAAKEELVAKERPDDGGDARSQARARRAAAAVVRGCVDLLEEPVVRRRLDQEDLGRQDRLGLGCLVLVLVLILFLVVPVVGGIGARALILLRRFLLLGRAGRLHAVAPALA